MYKRQAKSLYLQPSLVILNSVFHPNDHLQILVINNADDFVFLPERTKLGHFEPTPPDFYSLPNDARISLLTAQSENQSPSKIPQKTFTMAFNFGNDLSPDEKNLLFPCLLRNQDVFEKEGEPLRISNILEVTLPLKDPNKVAYEPKSYIPEAQGDLAEAV